MNADSLNLPWQIHDVYSNHLCQILHRPLISNKSEEFLCKLSLPYNVCFNKNTYNENFKKTIYNYLAQKKEAIISEHDELSSD